MLTSATGASAPKDYFEVPATNTLEVFQNIIRRSKEYEENQELARQAEKTLYPEGFSLRRGLPIIPTEYIVVGEVFMNYDFLIVGQQFVLENGKVSFPVRVIKNRRSGRMARPVVLLRSVDAKTSLEGLANIEGALRVTPNQVGANPVGEIHPGKSNGSGGTQGYPNAYGHSRPVLPASFLPLFEVFKPVSVPVTVSVPVAQQPLSTFVTPAATLKEIKVAILDTGLHHQLPGEVYWNESSGAVHTGWNFVDNTSNVDDCHPALHGTRIAAIIRQQAPSVVCLPVKTANDAGICELYDVLCGLEYARVNGANVINASFSFSTDDTPDQAIPLLHRMISVLENEGIWIVAAAGNACQYGHNNGTGVLLTKPLLYPACYSRVDTDAYDRVLTVTTIGKRHPVPNAAVSYSLDECYSPDYVDVGIIANGQPVTAVFSDDKNFKALGFVPKSEPGTSYATAYMSGLVAKALAVKCIDGKADLFSAVKAHAVLTPEKGICNQQGIAV